MAGAGRAGKQPYNADAETDLRALPACVCVVYFVLRQSCSAALGHAVGVACSSSGTWGSSACMCCSWLLIMTSK